jgi:hypothetical protein
MHSRTLEMLERIEKAPLFSRVGVIEGSDVAFVTSWSEAIAICDTSEWEDLQLDALNQYCKCLAERSMERFHRWNDTVDEVKKIARPLVARKIAGVVRENHLPRIFSVQVKHDITLVCMEAEYADVCPPGFFTSLGHWYVNGHFPCGWWGAFPLGKLVVY